MSSPKPNATTETPHELPLRVVVELRARSLCAEETIQRWWRGDPVKPVTDARLNHAAEEIGLSRKPRPAA